jgi:hypothetical protein
MAGYDTRHRQLFHAIYDCDDAIALSIVRSGVDVNGEYNGTRLFNASTFDSPAVVSCLLELGAVADKPTPFSGTTLGIAAACGFQKVVVLLVEVGNAQLI